MWDVRRPTLLERIVHWWRSDHKKGVVWRGGGGGIVIKIPPPVDLPELIEEEKKYGG